MTESDKITALIAGISAAAAIVSAVIAFTALVSSRRTDRAQLKLQLQIAAMSGHLKSIELLGRGGRAGLGFRALNGPDEVTINDVKLNVAYRMYWDPPRMFRGDLLYEFTIKEDEFEVLGVKRSTRALPQPYPDDEMLSNNSDLLGFRLAPNDVAVWRFPPSVTYHLQKNPSEISHDNGRRRIPVIELTLKVKAADNEQSSNPIVVGHEYNRAPSIFRYTEHHGVTTLENVILGALADEVLQVTSTVPIAQDIEFRNELQRLARRALPRDALGLAEWLLDIWEREGRFSDESTEEFARNLNSIRRSARKLESLDSLISELPSPDQQPPEPQSAEESPERPERPENL